MRQESPTRAGHMVLGTFYMTGATALLGSKEAAEGLYERPPKYKSKAVSNGESAGKSETNHSDI